MEVVTIVVLVIVGLLAVLAILGQIFMTVANLKKPVMSLSARVVAKRTEINGRGNNMATSTSYYITFEMEAGMREEFPVSGLEYGMIAEGDTGLLRRQGTWYKGFRRQASAAAVRR